MGAKVLSHAQSAPDRAGDFRNCANIGDPQQRVRGRLGPQELRIRPHSRTHGSKVGHVDEVDLKSPRDEEVAQ
jgi:hypothetical protein